jgi:Fe-S-cluster-containing hydrogenase component 2
LTQEIALGKDKKPHALRPRENCVKCGHCVITCPTAAISVAEITPESCQSYEKKEIPTIHQTDILLKSRRSVRNFLDKPVQKETIQSIIEVARYSPSGINAQPVRWLVVQDKQNTKRYASMTIDWLKSISKDPAWLKRIPIMPRYIIDWDSGRDNHVRRT